MGTVPRQEGHDHGAAHEGDGPLVYSSATQTSTSGQARKDQQDRRHNAEDDPDHGDDVAGVGEDAARRHRSIVDGLDASFDGVQATVQAGNRATDELFQTTELSLKLRLQQEVRAKIGECAAPFVRFALVLAKVARKLRVLVLVARPALILQADMTVDTAIDRRQAVIKVTLADHIRKREPIGRASPV